MLYRFVTRSAPHFILGERIMKRYRLSPEGRVEMLAPDEDENGCPVWEDATLEVNCEVGHKIWIGNMGRELCVYDGDRVRIDGNIYKAHETYSGAMIFKNGENDESWLSIDDVSGAKRVANLGPSYATIDLTITPNEREKQLREREEWCRSE